MASAWAASRSGHVVLADQATTGDGVLTALHLLSEVAATGRTLAELASNGGPVPAGADQRSRARQGRGRRLGGVAAAVGAAKTELGDSGRVLLRPSGTEPVVRVMVEARTSEQAKAVADRVAAVVAQA